ncbi:F0F1 ATP synthase subunit B [Gilliamella sp. ESL0232]|nr:F0F1 ATP synthase subunit B [Gilliamella sp. ESL0232]
MNATLLGQAITFVLFVWFCMKFVWPPVIGAIEKRQKEIAEGLASAETAKKDLELAKANTSDIMQQAKVEANAIIEQANKRKAIILEEAKQEASREKERIVAQGLAEVEAERKRAREELKQQVATLAIAGAEKIIERSVNEAANSDIIDKLVAEL